MKVKISKCEMGHPVGFKTVRGWPTRSKYLAVTPQVIPDSRWKLYKRRFAITHLRTGCVALRYFRSVRQAQLAAAVLGALPLKLATVTPKNSHKRKAALSQEWIRWLDTWGPN